MHHSMTTYRRNTIESDLAIYRELLAERDTLRKQKIFLSKALKEAEEYHSDLIEARQRPSKLHLGDVVTSAMVFNARQEVEIVKALINEINK